MKSFWNSRSSKIASLLFAIAPVFTYAQFSKPDEKFSNGEKYLYPINPGKPGSLAGTMGELRTTHFHSGIDIRTNNMTGFPVLASKSGYISRITMGPSGYGNIIYITHPEDGNTTLYAHLDQFKGRLADYVLQEQYRRKTSAIDLYFQEDQFVVKQGDTIALSGNSGSSGGPHLHFDIRDENNYALDPLRVADFPEVEDKLPPAPEKIALRTLDPNSRINDRFGRFEFYATTRVGNNYTIASPILASGLIGIEIIAKDRLAPGSPFYGGVNYIEMRVDSQRVFHQAIEKLDITETRAIYTLMDFKTMRNKGTRFYKLYIDDGNELKFYGASPGSGKIRVSKGKESLIEIIMKDSYGNSSVVSFRLKPVEPVKEVKNLEPLKTAVAYELDENILSISAKPCTADETKATIYYKGDTVQVDPDYGNYNRSVYLIDLRKNIPDSIAVCGETVVPNIALSIPPATGYKYYSDNITIEFPEQALYDTLYLKAKHLPGEANELFVIGDRTVPLRKSIVVALKPSQSLTWDKTTAVYRTAGKGYAYVGGQLVNGWVNFNTREFGVFTMLKDEVPPAIRVAYVDRTGARFKISDDLSGIASFEATVNGEWLLMHYDAKSATIWSEKLDKKAPIKGDFELTVTDNAGNIRKFNKKIL
ncbi:MAG TPA: M23 family metallopeptidase [Ohtaekwangia sp.]|nr:M23 family metallopeptidase [Ohtaekwangia sp.]